MILRPSLFRIAALAFVFASAFGSAHQAHAGKRELNALIQQEKRPTMAQVRRAMVGLKPGENPFFEQAESNPGFTRRKEQLPEMAKVIAFMEKAFPRAIWAPLGRDAVIFGDLLDAFYLSIGQRGRVSRLNASGASFSNEGDTYAMRYRLLKSAGLDLDHSDAPPFVGLDRTGFSPGSQSTNLIRAGYLAYEKDGGDSVELPRFFNFLGLSGDAPGEGLDNQMLRDYFSNVAVIEGDPENDVPPVLDDIMQLSVGNWTDSTPWHGTFGELTRIGRKVEGVPGEAGSLEDCEEILGEMIYILQAVDTDTFRAKVRAAAKGLGYEFPFKRSDYDLTMAERREQERAELLARLEKYGRDVRARLKERTQAFKRATMNEEEKTYLSENAQVLSEWLDHELDHYKTALRAAPSSAKSKGQLKVFKKNEILLLFIDELNGLAAQKKLLETDYRRLLARALSASQIDPAYLRAFNNIYQSEPLLEKTLKERQEFFLTTYKNKQRPGTENTEKSYRKIRRLVMKMPIDCAKVFDKKPEEADPEQEQ